MRTRNSAGCPLRCLQTLLERLRLTTKSITIRRQHMSTAARDSPTIRPTFTAKRTHTTWLDTTYMQRWEVHSHATVTFIATETTVALALLRDGIADSIAAAAVQVTAVLCVAHLEDLAAHRALRGARVSADAHHNARLTNAARRQRAVHRLVWGNGIVCGVETRRVAHSNEQRNVCKTITTWPPPSAMS